MVVVGGFGSGSRLLRNWTDMIFWLAASAVLVFLSVIVLLPVGP